MAKMARIAFLKAPGCVNRDENGQKVVGRVLARCASGSRAYPPGCSSGAGCGSGGLVRAGPGARRGAGRPPLGVRAGDGWACAQGASAGSQTRRGLGARRGRPPGARQGAGLASRGGCALGSRTHPPPGGGTLWEAECASGSRVRAGVCRGWLGMRPEGVCGESDALGGYLGRTGKLGGRGGRLPTRAPACPARPRTARLPTPRAPCWPSRPPVAPATSARPRTAGLATFCPRPAIRAFSRPPCKFGRFCTHRPPFASASRLIVSPLPTPTRGNDDPPRASVRLLAASRVQNRSNLQKRRLFPRKGPRAVFCAQPPTGASRPRISWQPASLVCRVVGRRPAGPSAGARFFSAAGRLAWRRHARSPILIKFETPRGRAPRARPLAENARDLG